ncbi:ImmA/IrrE family metallo-endopeptidase [Gallaecimonas kandeliae]|uniref:ImmA/IrrE family metallo-endopeptidase n=1 Tax=Gallaecimonas kandeliae TaxID=3029055 RepID=UPI00264836FF|nr:ImmA/IrrE family metallo-endopeptidase [Gallaecimonas kandeliae]WKE66260.1 ImmA/IrrE family metallo-endopeptidase [Gallaecimonas kandeliae]
MQLNPEAEAGKVLANVWQNRGFPVDPVTIAKALGLQVLDTELPEMISGALIKEAGKDPIIALHHADHPNRKRFSCAHELGHYVSRVESMDPDQEYEYVDLRGPSASMGTDPEERFANAFAASLLMPQFAVMDLVESDMPIFQISRFFGVSNEALKNRLRSLGLA